MILLDAFWPLSSTSFVVVLLLLIIFKLACCWFGIFCPDFRGISLFMMCLQAQWSCFVCITWFSPDLQLFGWLNCKAMQRNAKQQTKKWMTLIHYPFCNAFGNVVNNMRVKFVIVYIIFFSPFIYCSFKNRIWLLSRSKEIEIVFFFLFF